MSINFTTTKLALSFCLMTAALAGCAGDGRLAEGSYLDQSESRQLTAVTQQAADEGKPGERINWEHTDAKSGLVTTVGFVEPQSDSYAVSDGEVCRDLKQVVVKSGERHIQSAKACRKTASAGQPSNSTWVIRQS